MEFDSDDIQIEDSNIDPNPSAEKGKGKGNTLMP